jgi:Fe-Mn family superoxide dismutase
VFKLPELPYVYDALEPTISAETMCLHHDKHQAKYVETTNSLVEKGGLKPASLEALIGEAGGSHKDKLFNNAAQAWNHAFFFACMTPRRTRPDQALVHAIDKAFGGLEQMKQKFVQEGADHFGSGWVWLLAGSSGLEIRTTHDATDFVGEMGSTPLLACDLWEHAYYLDYRNDLKGFLKSWFDALPDWDFAGHQLQAARGGGKPWRYPEPEGGQLRRHG